MAARVLMVQGTASSVGKSLVAAALCRILRDSGARVAPFKAWNMALNSAVTPDGREIGRSTAAQAEAAGASPSADMNPVLVKPESGGRAQTIVLGRPEPEFAAMSPGDRSPALWTVISGALDRLRDKYDVIVAEGAGSPAEVNLRATDVANMRVALYANAPVLLVGDIDCGGVFAALLGTLMLLEPEERALVRGTVINKFRGEAAHLKRGLEILEQRTGVPVLGVVPFVRGLRLAEEDAVALDRPRGDEGHGPLSVAVIRLPHISNFDEFELLAAEPTVSLRYVSRLEDAVRPDLLIVPGSKCTAADLEFLRVTGLAGRIESLAHAGTPILGICGGYQMLGDRLLDPYHVESASPETAGLGLLPVNTTLLPVKRTRRVKARCAANAGWAARLHGEPLDGYEIHMGATEANGPPLLKVAADGEAEHADGCVSSNGLIAGTYVHGMFENAAARHALIDWLAERNGLSLATHPGLSRDAEYNRLAAAVRESLDMDLVLSLVGMKAS